MSIIESTWKRHGMYGFTGDHRYNTRHTKVISNKTTEEVFTPMLFKKMPD